MKKIGQFIYSWGNGHYSRMMTLDEQLPNFIKEPYEVHYSSKDEIYQKLLKRFPDKKQYIHEIMMPTPIDGKYGPSIFWSVMNFFLPVSNNPPLLKQIKNYLKTENQLFENIGFDLVINDGDMGPNVIAHKRQVKSIFVTNQFMPKLWKSRSYFYPGLVFISKQIAKATKIVVADSPPPYTICEYNLNFPDKVKERVVYAGHFISDKKLAARQKTDLERLIENEDYGYWMRTGNKSTNKITGKRFEEAFHSEEMKNEKRIISHATNDPSIDRVLGKDKKTYSVSEALEKKIDWLQIDIGFLSEQQKESVLDGCKYAVVNGSHTVLGEIIGAKGKPIIGIPVYDEHTNHIRWVQEHMLGLGAKNKKQIIKAIIELKRDHPKFEEAIREFRKHFVADGAKRTAKLASAMLDGKN